MSVVQTIGRLRQPVQDVLGGLHNLERHLNFPSDIYKRSRSLLYPIRLVPEEGGWPAPFGPRPCFIFREAFRCRDRVISWCSMCERAVH